MTNECSTDELQLAIAGDLPPDREQWLYHHLEQCATCSEAIEALAGVTPWCEDAAALLAGDELDEAVAEQAAAGRDEWSDIDFTVEHLEPAEEPNVLGRLGGYNVLQIIGRGGMSVVLKALDRELNRYVAIKVLAPHLAQSSLAKKRFVREARAAAAVVHPHVIAIHQVQPNGRLPFLVMPLVAGESLAQRLAAQGRLELKEILRIGMQAAAGLSAAHEQGLVHRDVKPANILLEKGVERAVLTDFGLARAADDVSMTRQGMIAGTPQYMSPEQARGEALDSRSDLFSLGCVLYEMATGVSPFRADSTLATLRRLIDDPPPSMAALNAELPPWFIAIVSRLLEKDPARRFSTAKEVSELLEGCLAHVQQPSNVPLPNVLISLREMPFPVSDSPHDTSSPAAAATSNGISRNEMNTIARRKPLALGAAVMLTLIGISLFAAGVATTNPPDISGQWSSEDWGRVALSQTAPGEYAGTYTETVAKGPGKIDLKWSRIERQFTGTWSEGEDRFGELSVHRVGNEIRGALTTDAKSKINPATPRLAPFLWTRAESSTAGKSTALHFAHPGSYAELPNLDMDRLTFATWVKRDEFLNRQDIVFSARDGGWDVYFSEPPFGNLWEKNNYVWFSLRGRFPVHSKLEVADTKWHFVAVTLDNHVVNFYIDGKPAGSARVEDKVDNGGGAYWLGGVPSDYDEGRQSCLQGCLEETLIFDRPLDAAEIAELYDRTRDGQRVGKLAGLIAGYHFDEGRGTKVADFSGHGNDGTLHGDVTWTRGKAATNTPAGGVSNALRFDGAGYVSIPGDNFRDLQSGTISVWVRPTGDGGTFISSLHDKSSDRQFPLYAWGHQDGTFSVALTAVSKDNRFLLQLDSDNRFPLDAWHHVVYSSLHGSGTFHLYVDGKLQHMHQRESWSQPTADFFFADTLRSSDDLQLGAKADSHNASGGFCHSEMRDLMIFNEPFSLEQVTALHAAGPGSDLSQYDWMRSLVAGYHFDEGRGTKVADFSSHGNDGTLHGDVTWVSGRTVADGPHPHALHFDQLHYALAPKSTKVTSGDFTISLWLKPDSKGRRGPTVAQYIINRNYYGGTQRGDFVLRINGFSGNLDFCLWGEDKWREEKSPLERFDTPLSPQFDGARVDVPRMRSGLASRFVEGGGTRAGWIFGWNMPETPMHGTVRFDEWNHVAITRSGDTYTMWMNGQRAATEKSSADVSDADNTNPFTIGGATSEPGVHELYRGDFDDFRVFPRCLSDGDIAGLYKRDGDATYLQGEGRVRVGQLCEAYWSAELFEGEKYPVPLPKRPSEDAPHANAMHLDGTSAYVDLGHTLDFSKDSAFSVSFWMNSTGPDQQMMDRIHRPEWRGKMNDNVDQQIVGKSKGFFDHGAPGWTVFTNKAGFLYFQLNASDEFRASELQAYELHTRLCDAKWHHVVVSYNGNQDVSGVAFYIDGAAQPLGTDSNNLQDGDIRNEAHAAIGATSTGKGFYHGALLEMQIFDRALTAADAAKLYSNGAGSHGGAQVGGLVAGYHLDEGQGTTVHDFSGHGNDGTLHGDVTWVSGRGMAQGPHARAVQFGAMYLELRPPSGVAGRIGLSDVASTATVGQWTSKSGEKLDINVTLLPPDKEKRTGAGAEPRDIASSVKSAVQLISTCAEGDPRVSETIGTLKGLDQAKVVTELAKFLSSQTDTVRRAAVYVLWKGEFKSIEPAVDGLLKLCDHQEGLTRGMAALALGSNKVGRSLSALEKMTTDDKSGYARRCAAYALGLLGDPAAIATLEKALKDPEVLVQHNTKAALEMLRKAADHASSKSSAKTAKVTTDQIVVEDLALQMIVAIRKKDDKKLRSFASDRIKAWPDALPTFAVELRERYRQNAGDEKFDLRAGESLVEGDLAAVRCTGPKELGGKCVVFFFIKDAKGWRNYSLRASMENVPLTEHLVNLKKQIRKTENKKEGTT